MMEIGRRPFLVAVLVGIAISHRGARADQSSDTWAREQIEWLARQPSLVSRSCDKECREFQFEYHLITGYAQGRCLGLHCTVERNLLGDSLLLVSPEGLPFLFSSDSTCSVPDPSQKCAFCDIIDHSFTLELTTLTRPLRLGFGPIPHRLEVDFSRFLSDLRSTAVAVRGVPCARTLHFEKANGATAEVRLSRERRPGQFPISMLALRPPGGPDICLTAFYVPRLLAGVGTENAPVRSLQESIFGNRWQSFLYPTKKDSCLFSRPVSGAAAGEVLINSLLALVCRDDCDSSASRTSATASAKRLLATMSLDGEFPDLDRQRVRELLGSLSRSSAVNRTDSALHQAVEALHALRTLIADRIVTPVRIEQLAPGASIGPPSLAKEFPKGLASVPVYLAGHERWRTAQRFEILAGPDLARLTYRDLQNVILDKGVSRELRLKALDLLGEIGVPDTSPQLSEIEKAIGTEGDAAIRALLASVRVRTGTPVPCDIDHLRAAVSDKSFPLWVRLVALESLMLADNTQGLETVIEKTLSDATLDCDDYGKRCLFAAGCSREGRRVLRKTVVEKSPARLFQPALFLIETSIGPEDPEWLDCLNVVESIAMDQKQPQDLRIKASQIASRGPVDRPFREHFICSAFQSGDAQLINYMCANYLTSASLALQHIEQFEALLKSSDQRIRDVGTDRIVGLFDRPTPFSCQEKSVVIKILRVMRNNEDPTVRFNSVYLWAKARHREEQGWADELLPMYVKMARNETDSARFAAIVMEIVDAVNKDLRLSCGSLVHTENYEMRPPEERHRLAEQYREQIVTQLERWVTEVLGAKEASSSSGS